MGVIRRHWLSLLAAALVVLVAVLFIAVTRTSPAYDAFGWLVWGHQTLHWNLNTDGAPSWKPLTYLFTLPYALFGREQLWLWVLTSTTAAFAGCALAGRLAYRLTVEQPAQRWAGAIAAVFTAAALFAIGDYAHLILICSSDPMVMALCLASIDQHLSGRHRAALLLVVLASLGRPEVWLFAFGYAVWCWRAEPAMRWMAAIGVLAIPALWFIVPGITAKSPFISGDLALNSKNIIHGSKLVGVFDRLRNQEGWPLEFGTLAIIGVAVWRRERRLLVLAGLAVLWTIVEYGFALHGWSAVPRYLLEPAAIMVVLSGVALGRALRATPRRLVSVAWVWPVLGVAMVLALIPYGKQHERTVRYLVGLQQTYRREFNRLVDVVDRLGGPRVIRSCGQPVTFVGEQSAVAWELQMNVGNVGFHAGRSIRKGLPVVELKPHDLGWEVRTFHLAPATAARCMALETVTATG